MRAVWPRLTHVVMTQASPIPLASHTPPASWSIAGLLLEAIAARDFTKMARCFEPEATMRALLPSGPADFHGAAEIVSAFRKWFGDAEGFEVLDATVGDVGMRLHASWRLRVRPTPRGDTRWHLIEQQTFAQAGERISSLDLLCSGFVPENHGGGQ
jgi:SnoaL-like domain